MIDSNAVRRLISQMPDFWHAEAKSMVARHIVNTNTTLALDARPDSLDGEINQFFHPHQRGDQMPMRRYPTSDQVAPTSTAASMPASFSAN